SQVRNAQGMADILCPMLGIDRETLIQKVSQKAQSSVILKRQVDRETVDALRELAALEENKKTGALSGLTFDEDRLRFYAMGGFMAQTLGLTNIDGAGQSGLEQQYDAYLAGTPGRIVTEVDAKARVLAGGNEYYIPPAEGASIKLTVDQSIQSFIDKALRECIEVNGARRVMAIMMDVNTGGILGMGIKPDYDPNNPPRDDLDLLQSLMRIQTISDVYEPGSTFKIFTASAALDLGLTSPTDGFYCRGSITVDGDRIQCWGAPHGAETMQKALQNSCNPVFVELSLRIGTENYYRYLRAFGFGVQTGIDLPGESPGLLIGQKYVKIVDQARIGFGQ
ncbi:MAG TPA: penicillin-binding transpeptidase domain-containing protein, partial [Clostridia bacterium]|nr:penicillin-binding transpeptidase domain-containing protein [Clostridia bacterium]